MFHLKGQNSSNSENNLMDSTNWNNLMNQSQIILAKFLFRLAAFISISTGQAAQILFKHLNLVWNIFN